MYVDRGGSSPAEGYSSGAILGGALPRHRLYCLGVGDDLLQTKREKSHKVGEAELRVTGEFRVTLLFQKQWHPIVSTDLFQILPYFISPS